MFRGHADAVIVSGAATGAPTDAQDVDMVRTAVPQVPLIIGSGVSPDNLPNPGCHGMIVGTTLKEGPRVSQERVELMVRLVEQTYSMG